MRDLKQAYSELNDEQKDAVVTPGNAVVLAGPGSGKTETLVIKVTHLLAESIPPTQGLACITFNNDAVREFRLRLTEFGMSSGRRLFLGTVHSFCLNVILRPYAAMVDSLFAGGVKVAIPRVADQLLEKALGLHEVNTTPSDYHSTLTKLRRRVACGEDISGFADVDPLVLADYERLLREAGLIDFEGMVTHSLELIEQYQWIRELVAARFPWLVVDEYQDLGGPLHRIVTTLIDKAGVSVFAVGDPDQTIYDFVGADPAYLDELAARSDFKPIRLKFNYRSGANLISAGEAALAPDEPRGYRPNPKRKDAGEVVFIKAADELRSHAKLAAASAAKALKAGTTGEQIAIFYRQRTVLLQDIRAALETAGVEYVPEKDSKFPSAPVVRWLKECAFWTVSPAANRRESFENLLRFYEELLQDAGDIDVGPCELSIRVRLFEALTQPTAETDTTLGDWLKAIDASLGLLPAVRRILDRSEDLQALSDLMKATEGDGLLKAVTLGEFAEDGREKGKVVLTTLHSCKGRQFDVVIIPGLTEGVFPVRPWNRKLRRNEEPSPKLLKEFRRLFYVGFTRARHQVHLIWSKGYDFKGHYIELGASRFVKEIYQRIKKS